MLTGAQAGKKCVLNARRAELKFGLLFSLSFSTFNAIWQIIITEIHFEVVF